MDLASDGRGAQEGKDVGRRVRLDGLWRRYLCRLAAGRESIEAVGLAVDVVKVVVPGASYADRELILLRCGVRHHEVYGPVDDVRGAHEPSAVFVRAARLGDEPFSAHGVHPTDLRFRDYSVAEASHGETVMGGVFEAEFAMELSAVRGHSGEVLLGPRCGRVDDGLRAGVLAVGGFLRGLVTAEEDEAERGTRGR